MKSLLITFVALVLFTIFVPSVFAQTATPVPPSNPCITSGALIPQPSCAIQVNQRELGFRIPSLSEILTFAIRAFFIISGLVALVYLLLGALAWITSGGDKENVSKAQAKITSAIIGVILIVVVLALIVTLEQIVFARRLCLGLSCPITIPSLLKPPGSVPGADTGSLNNLSGEEPAATASATVAPATATNAPTPTTETNRYNLQGTSTITPPGQEIIPKTGR